MKLTISPNTDAASYIRGKAVMTPGAFGRLPRELRGRAFSVAKISDFDLLRDMADKLATLPEGGDWREIRKGLAADLSPYMDESEDGRKAASAKAELLIRTHGFQAYASGRYRQQRETQAGLPYWQWLTVGDSRVREEHQARDKMTLRADDPWWDSHYPPDDWGCRCLVVAITEAEAKDMEVVTGADADAVSEEAAQRAEQAAGEQRPASGERSYSWTPGLRQRYSPDVWALFSEAMRKDRIEADGRRETAWEWLWGDLKNKHHARLNGHARKTGDEMAIIRDWGTGAVEREIAGGKNAVDANAVYDQAAKEGRTLRGAHVHPEGSMLPSPADIRMALHRASAGEDVHSSGAILTVRFGAKERSAATDELMTGMESWQYALDHKRKTEQDWIARLGELEATGVITMELEVAR